MGHVTAINECPTPAEPVDYVWSFPGSPIKVRLDLEVVKRMQGQFGRSAACPAKWGLLTGAIDGQTTRITGFRALAKGDAEEIDQAIAALAGKPGEHLLAGYYRTQSEEGLRLNEGDLSLARTFFRDPHHVVLLIQPLEAAPPNASFFFWDRGRMTGDFAFLEFPFDWALLANAERRRLEATQVRALPDAVETAPVERPTPPVPVPVPVRVRQPGGVRKAAVWTLVAACLAVAAAMGIWLFPQASARFLNRASTAAFSTPPAQPSSLPEQPSMGFAAERQNGDLKLTWRRDSAVIRSATSGVLSIEDGASRRELRLMADQVRGGSILYSPLSDQVQMQLTVSAPDATATESVIVINPRIGPPKVQTLSSNTVTAQTDRSPQQASGAPRPAPLRTFAPPAATPTASGPRVVLDAPPTLAANSNASVTRADALLNRPQSLAMPRPPAQAAAPAYYPPEAIRTATPVYPTMRQMVIRTLSTVEVAVSIDATGNVVKATAVPGQEMHPLLIAAALDAARRWKFRPARRGDQPIPSDMVLKFDFKPKQ